jgi:hypothetical protein
MQKNKTYYMLLLLSFGLFSFIVFGEIKKVKKDEIIWLNPTKEFIAGNNLQLRFQITGYKNPFLYVHYSIGKTILKPNIKGKQYIFDIPHHVSQKAGMLSLKIFCKNEFIFSKTIHVLPLDNEKKSLEAYLGSTSTWVGPENYVTFITIPLDEFDNVLKDGTIINFKENINQKLYSTPIISKNLISWKHIYAPTKSGKIFVSSTYKDKATSEYEADIYPSVGQAFTIYYDRLHDYADGNQLTTLYTSVIKDKYGNLVSNGTKVNFEFTDENNNKLRLFGTTKDGIAKAQWLHPEKPKKYTISANIYGLTTSNQIKLAYKSWNFTIDYQFENKNRILIIGPLKSYMGQSMPNGTKVVLKIYRNNKLINEFTENTINGVVRYQFKPHKFEKGIYNFEIETMNKTLMLKQINLN